MKGKTLAVLGLSVGLLASAGIVEAGTSYSGYSTTVGKFNGSGYTGYQTKSTSGKYGNLSSGTVGGNYVVDARMSSGSWVRNVTDNDYRSLPNSVASGNSARVQFSNDFDTPVNVQVSGSWRSN